MEGEVEIAMSGSISDEQWGNLWELLGQAISYTKKYEGDAIILIPCDIEAEKGVFIQLKEKEDWLDVGFTAPVALRPGDLCWLSTTDGRLLVVWRDDEVIYAG